MKARDVSGLFNEQSHNLKSNANGFSLSDEHYAFLSQTVGLSDDAIHARGYFSLPANDKGRAWLRKHKFRGEQMQLGECLVCPTYNQHGNQSMFILHPNHPRCNRKGKPIIYEYPPGCHNQLDISPLTWKSMSNPHVDVVWTEGPLDADSAAQQGLLAISLNGIRMPLLNRQRAILRSSGALNIPNRGLVNGRRTLRRHLFCQDLAWNDKDEIEHIFEILSEGMNDSGGLALTLELPCHTKRIEHLYDFCRAGNVSEFLTGFASECLKLEKSPYVWADQMHRALSAREQQREVTAMVGHLTSILRKVHQRGITPFYQGPDGLYTFMSGDDGVAQPVRLTPERFSGALVAAIRAASCEPLGKSIDALTSLDVCTLFLCSIDHHKMFPKLTDDLIKRVASGEQSCTKVRSTD